MCVQQSIENAAVQEWVSLRIGTRAMHLERGQLGRLGRPGIPSAGNLVDRLEDDMIGPVLAGHLGSAVGGVIVDDDDRALRLTTRQRLHRVPDSRQGRRQEGFLVVGRDDDGVIGHYQSIRRSGPAGDRRIEGLRDRLPTPGLPRMGHETKRAPGRNRLADPGGG